MNRTARRARRRRPSFESRRVSVLRFPCRPFRSCRRLTRAGLFSRGLTGPFVLSGRVRPPPRAPEWPGVSTRRLAAARSFSWRGEAEEAQHERPVRKRGNKWCVVIDGGRTPDDAATEVVFRFERGEAEDELVTILGRFQRSETIDPDTTPPPIPRPPCAFTARCTRTCSGGIPVDDRVHEPDPSARCRLRRSAGEHLRDSRAHSRRRVLPRERATSSSR